MASDTATSTDRQRVLLSAGPTSHGVARVASGIRTAAGDAGIRLSVAYSQRIASEGLARCEQVGVTRLGAGVVIHTAPANGTGLPVVLGYADPDGEWFRDGTRHQSRADGSR